MAIKERSDSGAIHGLSADFEREILAAEPDNRRDLIEQSVKYLSEAHVESLSAKARAASAASPSESMRIAGIVAEVADAVETKRAHALADWARGAALRAQARCKEALEAFKAGAAMADLCGDPLLAARIPLGATETLAQLGRYDEALLLSHSLETRFHDLGCEEDAVKVVANAGNIHFQREDFAEALTCWRQALSFFEARGDQMRSARLQMNVANVLVCLHRLSESMQMYESARVTLDAAGMELLVAGLDGDLGYLRFLAGQHSESLQSYARARHRFEALGLPKDVAQCDREMADVYLDLNLVPEALEIYRQVLPVFQEKQMVAEAARCEFGIAKALVHQAQHAEAGAALLRAEQSFIQEGNRVSVARIWLSRANFLYRQLAGGANDLTLGMRACRAAEQALRVFRQQGLERESVQARLQLLEIRVILGQCSRRPLRQLARMIESGAYRSLQWRIETASARASRDAGQLNIALKHSRIAVEAIQRTRLVLQGDEFQVAFLQDKAVIYEELIGLLLDRDTVRHSEEAFAIMEHAKSRALLESMIARPTTTDANDLERQAIQSRLEDLRARLNWEYMSAEQSRVETDRRPPTASVTPEELRAMEKEFLHTRRQLEMLTTGISRPSASWTTSLSDIQSQLTADEQILAYGMVHDEIFAYVVGRDTVEVVRGLASRTEVEELIERLRFQWHQHEITHHTPQQNASQHDTAHAILGTLYAQLFEPLQYLLHASQVTVIPHGVLHGVPFHALYDGNDYLIDLYEIAYAPSCAIWLACRQRDETLAGESLILCPTNPNLVHTREELDNLRKILPDASILEGEDASVAAIPTAGTYRIIHIACHATYRKDNPLFSALRMSDGWLFAHDLFHRRLECGLATLSACHTGSGTVAIGDEVQGLVRGFLQAGARAVLVSLWAADDAATAALMTKFYSAMEAGNGRAGALRAAYQAIREQWRHPYYWASFALIGAR